MSWLAGLQLAGFEVIPEDLHQSGVRSYIPEPDRGKRNWDGKELEKKRVEANRRRTQGERGKALQRLRSEHVERSFAHMYETGGMRRVHLRGRKNILKRLLFHAVAFNLALLVRKLHGMGKPRTFQGLSASISMLISLLRLLNTLSSPNYIAFWISDDNIRNSDVNLVALAARRQESQITTFTTGC